MVDTIRPLSDLDAPGGAGKRTGPEKEKTLYLKLPSQSHPLFARLEKLLIMFPGKDRMVVVFDDTRKRMGAPCLHHSALIEELKELCGEENVVLK